MELRFFGLTQNYRLDLFRQIHEIVFYGKGGYDFDTVYNLPIWLRNFIHFEIIEAYKAKAKQLEDSGSKTVSKEGTITAGPKNGKNSTYTIKRPAKH